MKKVLYVATVLSHICQFHLPYLKMFQENGYEVHIAARNNLAEKNGLQLKYADNFIEVPFQRSPASLRNIKAYKQLKKLLNQEYYDLIVCNTPMGGILTRLAAKKTRKKGTKVVYIAHGFHFYKGASKKNWLFYYPIEKHFAKKCDVVVTINNEDYSIAKQKFKTRVERIHGVGVDCERYYSISSIAKEKKRADFGYGEKEFIALVVGELLPNKNQIQAIKAIKEVIKKHSNIRLLIAGNGKERAKLEKYVFENNLTNNVQFLGYCTNLEEYQCIVDLGISCSIREGLGINVIESMMSGNTFIATKNRGHNELIQDGENGFLVDVGDERTLANRIIKLIENPELKKRLEEAAKKRIHIYTLSETIKEIESIFASL
ncbi:MAG: glycosyltransferase family 4 protein [Clostridia bacterium]|nr:glycosyltransferase family 4 protein [Clostridia bacterium]